uniref:Scm polycomb group protein like 2 n=1 Tax=Tetraodon nigroviridis TaxID=99883 RepID=H3CVU2_TETNG
KKRGPKPKNKQKKPVVQSHGTSSIPTPPPETRLSTGHISAENNHGNGSNVVCTVCVYVNKHGTFGPHLDRKLVQQLPDHFGPAPVNSVLQQAVQACVDCTYQPSVLLSFLQSQSHTGGEVIRVCVVRSEHGIRYVKLPTASSTSSVLRFLENMCQYLESDCLFSSQPFSPFNNNDKIRWAKHPEEVKSQVFIGIWTYTPCTRIQRVYLSFSHEAEPLSHNENGVSSDNSTKDPAGGAVHSTPDYRAAKKERPYYPGQTHTPPPLRRVSSNPTELGPVSAHRRVEAASSTTGPDHLKQDKDPSATDASSWSVDDVIRFVQEADPQTLGPHIDLFRKHEIDGKALMLLRSDIIMKYMGLKLGPALKLCHHIERLKQTKQ